MNPALPLCAVGQVTNPPMLLVFTLLKKKQWQFVAQYDVTTIVQVGSMLDLVHSVHV